MAVHTYPDEAKYNGYSGKAIVQFIVDTNGKVLSPQIIKSAGYKCLNDEAIRVVGKMPSWNPGYNSGKSVMVNVNMQVSFSINSNTDDVNPNCSFLPKKIIDSKTVSSKEKDSITKINKANYYYYQGVLQAEFQNFRGALIKFNESLNNESRFNDALFNKAVMHFKLEEKAKACETWNKIMELNKNDKEVAGLIKKHCS